jgi:chemotaxis protein MotB
VAFEQGSVSISEKAKKALIKMLPIIGQMQNNIEISGHTDESDSNQKYPSNWDLSVARASVIAAFLESKLIPVKRIQVAGYGDSRPRFNPDTAYKRNLNRRVQILLLPEDQTR